jgi:hypothetical protein
MKYILSESQYSKLLEQKTPPGTKPQDFIGRGQRLPTEKEWQDAKKQNPQKFSLKEPDWGPISNSEMTHDILEWGGLGVSFFGPYGAALGMMSGLANAKLYWNEGKKPEAMLSLMFSIIPGGQLVKKIPSVKKFGKEFFEKILLKSRKGVGTFTKTEREAWDELMKNKKWIKSQVSKKIFRNQFKSMFERRSFSDLVVFIWMLKKKHPIFYGIGNYTITIGGIYYTWDKLIKIFGLETGKPEIDKVEKINDDFKKNSDEIIDSTSESLEPLFMMVPLETRDSLFQASF